MIYPDGFTTKRVIVMKSRPLNLMALSPLFYTIMSDILEVK